MKINHVLSNGQKVSNIQGRVVNINDKTIPAYVLIAKKEQEDDIKEKTN